VRALAVMTTGFRPPTTSRELKRGIGSSSAGATVDENACWARSLALVRVATESDIRRLKGGRTGGLKLEFENVWDLRSCNRTGRCSFNQYPNRHCDTPAISARPLPPLLAVPMMLSLLHHRHLPNC
jgi:hypothetical protein